MRLNAARVSPALLRTLGIVPILGRVFEDDEETPGNDRVALLGEELWQRQFESDPDILGRVITLDDAPYTVVGVFDSDLDFPQPETELWVPVALSPASERVQGRVAVTGPAIARLGDGVSIERATAEINTIFRRLYPPVSAANAGPQGQGRGRGETPNAPGEGGRGEGGTAVARGGTGRRSGRSRWPRRPRAWTGSRGKRWWTWG